MNNYGKRDAVWWRFVLAAGMVAFGATRVLAMAGWWDAVTAVIMFAGAAVLVVTGVGAVARRRAGGDRDDDTP